MCVTQASVSTLLTIVGRREDARDGGEGRLDAGLATLALQALDQARLLAADVGACAAVDRDVERVAGAEDVLSEKALRGGLFEGRLEDARAEVELAADVDVRGPAPERVGGEDDPLDQLVRVLFHEEPVLERAGLRLVRVAEKVDGLALGVLGTNVHLRPVGKPAPPRPRRPDFLTSSVTFSGVMPPGQDLAQRCVAAVGDVGLDRAGVGLADPGEQNALHRQEALSLDRRSSSCVHLPDVDGLVVRVVDHDRGRLVAARDALDLEQRERAVLRRLLEADAQAFPAMLHERAGPGQVAGEGRADLDQMPADRLQVVHRVKGQDAVDVRGRQVQDPRDFLGRLLRDPAPRLLRHPQHRQERRLLGRIAREDLLDPRQGLRREGARLPGLFDAIPKVAHQSNAPFFQMYA